jgi:hypothetical protein
MPARSAHLSDSFAKKSGHVTPLWSLGCKLYDSQGFLEKKTNLLSGYKCHPFLFLSFFLAWNVDVMTESIAAILEP